MSLPSAWRSHREPWYPPRSRRLGRTICRSRSLGIGREEVVAALVSRLSRERLVTVERGIDQPPTSWLAPELLRIKGELLLLHGNTGPTEAVEDVFRQALDGAHRQETLSWELRAATSLARLLCGQSRSAEALTILQPVYDRFTEGFDTTDLRSAKALLDALRRTGSGTTADAARPTLVRARRRASPAPAVRRPD